MCEFHRNHIDMVLLHLFIYCEWNLLCDWLLKAKSIFKNVNFSNKAIAIYFNE